jgi:hypothetical protein
MAKVGVVQGLNRVGHGEETNEMSVCERLKQMPICFELE